MTPPIAGAIIDQLGDSPGFAIALASGLILGAAALWVTLMASDPGDPNLGETSVSRQVKDSLHFRPFRRLALFQVVTSLVQGSYSFLLDILYLKHLGISYLTINLFVAISKGAKGVSASSSGWLRRLVPPLKLMKRSGVAQALVPLLFLAARPGAVWLVLVALALTELAQGVFSVSEQTMQMKWASTGDQTADVSVLMLARGVAASVMPTLSAGILRASFGLDVRADTIDPQPIFGIIVIATVIRLAAFLLLPRAAGDIDRVPAALD